MLAINVIFLLSFSKFPIRNKVKKEEKKETTPIRKQEAKGNVWIDGTLFTMFSFISQGVFLLISTWITKYGEAVVNMGDVSSRALVSYYSIGSITCVLLTIFLSARGIQDVQFLFVYMLLSFISLLTITIN